MLSIACLAVAGTVQAATPSQLYATCAACHGARGEGNVALAAPAIAGQSPAYLTRQLQHFRNGVRGTHARDVHGAQMRNATLAVLRNDADLAALAKHVAAMPRTSIKPAAGTDARNGNNLYEGKCGACHGGRAEGNDAFGAPRLAGLDAAYFKRQLQHFRTGLRGAHASDTYGKQMALMAPLLVAERDVNDVIAHVHRVGAAK